jgi:hypothetical protein
LERTEVSALDALYCKFGVVIHLGFPAELNWGGHL